LDSAKPGGPHRLEISSPETAEIFIIRDVYAGDVWLCSGQSNMELPMQRLRDDFPEEWQTTVPLIRQFKAPQEWEFAGPRADLSGGCWTVASAETLHEFSGTAWFFAKKIFENYNMPIGLIIAAWGGSPVEAWMSREALAAFPDKIARGEQYADAARRDAITRRNEAEIQEWEARVCREDRGLAESWQQPRTDSAEWRRAGWREINLPGNFAAAGLDQFCGVVWLRRECTVGANLAGKPASAWLGTIVDADTVYVNGVEIGNTTYRYPPRKYPIPAGLLREGVNEIVIRVVCCKGEGEVTHGKSFRIFSDSGSVDLTGNWLYRVGMTAVPRPDAFFFQWQPMGLYNAMIAPLLDYPVRGVIWYQGESNDGNPGEYGELFTALIKDWRRKRRQPDLPFLFVQLPIFGEPKENDESSSWAIIREAQRSALSLPSTGMAAGLDLGEWNDLHPINKKDIGRRLALAAERVVFKNKNTAPGPMHRATQRRQNRLLITFDNCGAGLTAHEKPYVSIVSGGALVRLPAHIESPECVSVDISSIKNPEKVLYAWANNPRDRQLYNADGLPVIPFRVTLEEAAS
jgi:sialate O-acetylesterase